MLLLAFFISKNINPNPPSTTSATSTTSITYPNDVISLPETKLLVHTTDGGIINNYEKAFDNNYDTFAQAVPSNYNIPSVSHEKYNIGMHDIFKFRVGGSSVDGLPTCKIKVNINGNTLFERKMTNDITDNVFEIPSPAGDVNIDVYFYHINGGLADCRYWERSFA